MCDDVAVRLLATDDPATIAAAFSALGWVEPGYRYNSYLSEQQAGSRVCFVAERGGSFAGHCTLIWTSHYEPFRVAGIPEISDLNVLPWHRNIGIGSKLLDAVECAARQRSSTIGLGVGLSVDYGPAQRLYVRRGYIPDGRGVIYQHTPVESGTRIVIDDDAALMFTRDLRI
ncbi:MAG TPA: GNAT family N-acetyltransferase [Mycobacterium sp.]|nr:GNAT family N-acetyltransferase [Mycobacterium sp.]